MSQVPSMRHPYSEFEGTEVWRNIDKGISDLVENKDLIEQTNHAYIVGYLCKTLKDAGITR